MQLFPMQKQQDYAFASNRFYVIELPNPVGQNVLSARSNQRIEAVI